jgi:hypothetical protein
MIIVYFLLSQLDNIHGNRLNKQMCYFITKTIHEKEFDANQISNSSTLKTEL